MGLDAILFMTAILIVVWGGFIAILAIAVRQEHRLRKEEEVGRDAHA